MNIVLKNRGVLQNEVDITPGELTIFPGGNNTGKTYAMYVLWALLAYRITPEYTFAKDLLSRIQTDGSVQIPVLRFCAEYWNFTACGLG